MVLQERLSFSRVTETIFSHIDESVQVRSYGNIFDYDPKETDLAPQRYIIEHLTRPYPMQAWSVLWQRLPNDRMPRGRFVVEHFEGTLADHLRFVSIPKNRCDGIIIDAPHNVVAMTSRDCPILVLYRQSGGPVAVIHCSRSSLTGIDRGEQGRSVIHEALGTLGAKFTTAKDVRGVLTMGIAPEHFNNERYPIVVEHLRNQHGESVIGGTEERPTIDLYGLVCAQVALHGIDPARIVHDGLDTFSNEKLASVRAQRGGHNLTLVLRTR